MFKTGLSSCIKSFVSNMHRFGLLFAVKYGLDFLGMDTYINVCYPATGTKVRVRTDNFWKKLESGDWEKDAIEYLSTAAGQGQTIIDAGAWIGPYTLLFSAMVANEGRVYAFEPDPEALKVLKNNVSASRCGNVCIENLCLSSNPGNAGLKTCRTTRAFGLSDSTIIQPSGKEVTGEITVPTTTIDRYCTSNGITPDGIKIDVEGAEGMVIEGARRTIARCAPWVLLEFHGHLMDKQTRTECWQNIIAGAKKIIYIDKKSQRPRAGAGPDFLPGSQRLHVFIRY